MTGVFAFAGVFFSGVLLPPLAGVAAFFSGVFFAVLALSGFFLAGAFFSAVFFSAFLGAPSFAAGFFAFSGVLPVLAYFASLASSAFFFFS